MSFQIPDAWQIAYDANWKFVVQQPTSRLGASVMRENVQGESLRKSYMGKSVARKVTSRLGESIPQDTEVINRWVRPQPYEQISWIDENDKVRLGSLPEPKNEFLMNHRMAFGRLEDQIIINALVGNAYVGDQGLTPVALPASQVVAVNYVPSGTPANSGLTLGKLTQAKYLLDDAMVPMEDRHIAMSAKQLSDLLANVVEVQSSDYANVKALVDGKVDYFMGFNFHIVEKSALPYNASTDVRTIVAYWKGGISLGVGHDPKGRIDVLPQQRHTIQVRSTVDYDAARLEENTVVTILTDESPA